MLLDAGRPGEALLEFEVVPETERRRFRSSAGAAAAAERAGIPEAALAYHAALVAMAERGDRLGRTPLEAVRRALRERQ
jgi:hypothetical protein